MESLKNWLGSNLSLLAPAIIALVVPLALSGLAGSVKAKAQKREGLSWVEYGRTFKVFTFIGMMIPTGLCLIWFNVEGENRSAVLYMILLFGGLIVPLFMEAFFVRIAFDDRTVYCYSPWRPSRKVSFLELGEPSYSQSLQWWVIPTKKQGYIRLQSFISGADKFLAKVREQRKE